MAVAQCIEHEALQEALPATFELQGCILLPPISSTQHQALSVQPVALCPHGRAAVAVALVPAVEDFAAGGVRVGSLLAGAVLPTLQRALLKHRPTAILESDLWTALGW